VPGKKYLISHPLLKEWRNGFAPRPLFAPPNCVPPLSPWSPTLPDADFDGIIFDCDGTLADTMPVHYQAWCAALGDSAYHFTEASFYLLGGVPTPRIVEILNERHGLTLPVDVVVTQKEALFLEMCRNVLPIDPVIAVARQFHTVKPLAVASGGHRHVVMHTLDAIGITHLFETVVTSEDYANGKPSPDPFLEAARRLGLAPERCLVFEDTEIGRSAATAAGMRCIMVPIASERLPR
jgi:HAD superfamily hydrolase (TIGR01509 family)